VAKQRTSVAELRASVAELRASVAARPVRRSGLVQFDAPGPITREKHVKLAPGAERTAKTGPNGPKTMGVWREFYAFALLGLLSGILP
jgi:hypothetical protein